MGHRKNVTPAADEPTLPVADDFPSSPVSRRSWPIALVAGAAALPFFALRLVLHGASRLGRRLRTGRRARA